MPNDTINNRNYRKHFPEKCLAHTIVNTSLRNGTLLRLPCSVCGDPKSEAHHNDYSKPLEIIWLCHEHHISIHHGEKSIRDENNKNYYKNYRLKKKQESSQIAILEIDRTELRKKLGTCREDEVQAIILQMEAITDKICKLVKDKNKSLDSL